jgi:hypothetical protein
MSEEAQEFASDLPAAREVVQKLQQGNLGKVQALAQMGKQLDPGAIANIKIDTFIASFLDEGAQLVYVRNLETQLRNILDEELKASRQEMLTVPKGFNLPKR